MPYENLTGLTRQVVRWLIFALMLVMFSITASKTVQITSTKARAAEPKLIEKVSNE